MYWHDGHFIYLTIYCDVKNEGSSNVGNVTLLFRAYDGDGVRIASGSGGAMVTHIRPGQFAPARINVTSNGRDIRKERIEATISGWKYTDADSQAAFRLRSHETYTVDETRYVRGVAENTSSARASLRVLVSIRGRGDFSGRTVAALEHYVGPADPGEPVAFAVSFGNFHNLNDIYESYVIVLQ